MLPLGIDKNETFEYVILVVMYTILMNWIFKFAILQRKLNESNFFFFFNINKLLQNVVCAL
jgi:hypothetical protein